MNVSQKIDFQMKCRYEQAYPVGLKINLYTANEVFALSAALSQLKLPKTSPVESLMVGDSYFTTHLNRPTTALKTEFEKKEGLAIMLRQIKEVSTAMQASFDKKDSPYLIGDMPDGSYDSPSIALRTAEAMCYHGANVIKLEITSKANLFVLEALTANGFVVMGHLGYTPQTSKLFRYADTLASAIELLDMVRHVHDAGAKALVIEMVSETLNQRLCLPESAKAMQIYSIFSGKAKFGGQSLNVWDSTIRPKQASRYFPPTAHINYEQYPDKYNQGTIVPALTELIRLTLAGDFPLSPQSKLTHTQKEQIISINPWEKLSSQPYLRDKFNALESNTRVYCRKFPKIFKRGVGSIIYDIDGHEFIDFFCGAGVLNYGHNNDLMKQALKKYMDEDGITHGLDLHTEAKYNFINEFNLRILEPRHLNYKLQFVGPTGTNAVEAAFKIARKITGRSKIIAFTNGFHGMTLGALAATGNKKKRLASHIPLQFVDLMPYDGYMGKDINTIDYLDSILEDSSSGIDLPAAFIVETVQGEGGLNAASKAWLVQLQQLANKYKILLIIDDIQAGCGRTGTFFSFEDMGIEPDVICLSKSLSGYGLPLSLVLLKPALDIQEAGEHSGTFRGNNLAFVTATVAIGFWHDHTFLEHIAVLSSMLQQKLVEIASAFGPDKCQVKGRGLFAGLGLTDQRLIDAIVHDAYRENILIEGCGGKSHVIKVMPALTMGTDILSTGLAKLQYIIMKYA